MDGAIWFEIASWRGRLVCLGTRIVALRELVGRKSQSIVICNDTVVHLLQGRDDAKGPVQTSDKEKATIIRRQTKGRARI